MPPHSNRHVHPYPPCPVDTPQAELSLWEEGVVRSAKSLNQWELLSEYAKAWPGSQPALLMECAWKSADWDRLRDLFSKCNLRSQARMETRPGLR